MAIIVLPLHYMTVGEKLAAMETIWASLLTEPADVASPAWHAGVLKDGKQRLESGDVTVSEWSAARNRWLDLGQQLFKLTIAAE